MQWSVQEESFNNFKKNEIRMRGCFLAVFSKPFKRLKMSLYRRVMLKVSGEALQGGFIAGTDPKVATSAGEMTSDFIH